MTRPPLALAVLLLLAAPAAAQEREAVSIATLEDGLAALRQVDGRAAELAAAIERLKGTEGFSTEYGAEEEEPPLVAELRALEAEGEALDARRTALIEAVREAAQLDRAALLRALARAPDAVTLEVCAPIAAALGRSDPEAAKALVECARRLQPAPAPVRAALADLGGPEPAGLLLDLGLREKDPLSLRQALAASFEVALPRVLEAAGAPDPALVDAAGQALDTFAAPRTDDAAGRLEGLARAFGPAGARGRVALVGLIVRHVPDADEAATEAGAALNDLVGRTLLGLSSQDLPDGVRAAIALAGGAVQGEPGAALVLAGLADPAAAVRRAAAAAAGRGRHRAAAPALLDLLEEGEEGDRRAARAALKAVAGRDLGDDVVRWRRWWALQPATD
ncbi:MAG: hypothetical protein M9894_12700 [Planctomycetes bacterium]|nr:hypothetical protein [Planctomycetota bacterium]